eukprot:4288084-Lingulodinium_polyedra.AAC.1
MAAHGCAAPASRPAPVRWHKRGPGAWDHAARPRRSLQEGGITRLLVHAVADRIFTQWDPKVEDFLLKARRLSVPLHDAHH